ncbi:unnamed protein product [Microthlaspi erraticum]|uniref:Uncharacterized protein n=1 Tax=Microthlaspi erraticum TaxID=1685480 RepID=A0A6D2LND8_9BRAS|nr:unnamed protein product [Microthlaspi erraticum]
MLFPLCLSVSSRRSASAATLAASSISPPRPPSRPQQRPSLHPRRLPATLRRIRLDGSTKKPLRTSGGSRLTRNRSNRLIAVIHGDALSLSVFGFISIE